MIKPALEAEKETGWKESQAAQSRLIACKWERFLESHRF